MTDAAQHDLQISDAAGVNPLVSAAGPAGPGLEQVVRDHLDEITRLAYRLLGWHDDVEDIVQDVFLSAAQKLGTLRDRSSIRTWLYQVTINKCRTWRYRQKLRLKFWISQCRQQGSDASNSYTSEIQERDIQVRNAVKALPTKYREAVVLRYLEQLPGPEIARMLKINESALNVRLLRARTMLREKLEILESEA
jgi:RNA polymerase sigma-70 factor (ECF subfamily)